MFSEEKYKDWYESVDNYYLEESNKFKSKNITNPVTGKKYKVISRIIKNGIKRIEGLWSQKK